MTYNWEQPDWPQFRYDLGKVQDLLFSYLERIGRMTGQLEALPDSLQLEALIHTIVTEAIKTSEIEGEYLSREDVMSSVCNQLGLNPETISVPDQRAQGISQLMLAVRKDDTRKLSQDVLFSWHQMVMQGTPNIQAGAWRTGSNPMQVVSGAVGKEKIHFEAPPADRLPTEMNQFIRWFNDTHPDGKTPIKPGLIRSAIAHLYFESIHPFEDGNGRIGRALSELALSQEIHRPMPLSLSRSIEKNRNDYYDALKKAQRSNEISEWLHYFVAMVLDAQTESERQVDFILKKAKFFDRVKNQLNPRQLKVVQRMLDAGPEGFEGGMSAKKYISITKTTKATATRDLQDLAKRGMIRSTGAGRSTRYQLNL
ncbi:MAG: DUF4172 domain-containing protein [Verrucomicrobiota bacterium]